MGKEKFFSWLVVALWCLVIYKVSDIPHLKTDLGLLDLILRKIAHMAEYGILYFLFYRALRKTFVITKSRAFIAGLCFCVIYAVSDEVHQSFVPGRSGSWQDVVSYDLSGILISAYAVRKFYKI